MTHRPFHAPDERGITVSEVLLALALFAALSVSLISILRSSAKHGAEQEQRNATQVETWRAIDQIVDDVQVAALAPELSTAKDLGQSLPLLIQNEGGKPTLVQWQVSSQGLQRFVSEAVLGAKPHPTLGTSLVVASETEATFVYLSIDGQELDPRLDPEKLRLCTARIEILVHSQQPEGELDLRQASASFRLNPELLSC